MTTSADRIAPALSGRYAIERELGHGGMAIVYLGRDIRHGRAVAIKVLRPELSSAMGGARFLREINIAAQLQSPHILPVLDSGEADGLLFYVMPFVDGESLRSLLTKSGALPASEAVRFLRDIVDGVDHAHRHGVMHRDIKPDNVMIADRHAVVVDFGVAKALHDASSGHNLTSIGISLGTPAYMAPEQAAADPAIDHRADIYAIGVVAYEMLSGRTPFTGSPQAQIAAHISQAPPPLASITSDVPAALAAIVMRCLEKDPARRYQTAAELLDAIEGLATPSGGTASGTSVRSRAQRRTLAGVAISGALLIGGAAYTLTVRVRRERWVHNTAIPAIQRLATAVENDSAFALATEADVAAPGDSVIQALLRRVSVKVVIRTEPEGATVYRARFADTSRWELVGTTPTDSVRVPASAYTRLRIEKPGYRSIRVLQGGGPRVPFLLDSIASPDSDMVHVSGGTFSVAMPGLDHVPPISLVDFLIGRHEVTNREYKAFVAAGAYAKPELWSGVLGAAARGPLFDSAMRVFKDKTGRPGPATWEAGDIPPGQEDFPVAGVSWYEAKAYAQFVHRSLPTAFHWSRAAEMTATAWIVPGSNMEAKGLAKGSRGAGMSVFGAFDMAGNVREWCENEDAYGARYILGGGFSDPTYAFNDAYVQPALDRSVINGIRLAKYVRPDSNLAHAQRPLAQAYRDYNSEQPVSDAVFEPIRRMYDYDRTPLNVKVESRDTTPDAWITERVSMDAAYGHERLIVYVFTPKGRTGPLQTVIHFPGDGYVNVRSSAFVATGNAVDFLIKGGRAVIYPIYKSTNERSDSLPSTIPNESIGYRDHVLMWVKDLRRALDYAETRADLDTARVAYFGFSWGGRLGGLIPAVEPRIKTVLLLVAGLRMQRALPEADPFNFLPRVKVPVLMMDAKYDNYFPVESSQKPFFRLLGTPAAQKRYVLYEGGHILPRTQVIGESLAWLDKYFGPVR